MSDFSKFFQYIEQLSIYHITTYACIVLVIGLFLYFFISLEIKIRKLNQSVGRALNYLSWSNSVDAERNYEEINYRFTQDIFWSDYWREYDEYLVKSPNEEGDVNIFSPNDAFNFFSPLEIAEKKINLRIFNSVQSTLTTIGILGTFIGLALGIEPLGDAEKIRLPEIQKLISGKPLDIVYSVSENYWNGKTSLQLEIKGIKYSDE